MKPVCYTILMSDSNECVNNNGGCEQFCYNLIPGYHCDCQDGYALADDGHTCNGCFTLYHIIPHSVWLIAPISDIDECLSNPCDANATCVNINGSFVCTCDDHFSGDGMNCTRLCENGYQLDDTNMICGKCGN